MIAFGTLRGSRALVTGAGSGIGRATAIALGRAGATVAAVDIDPVGAALTAQELAREDIETVSIISDVGDPASVRQMVAEATRSLGGIDILVNNAGIGVVGDVVSTTDEDLARVMAVNVAGTFVACREVIPGMLERGGGIIVNIASAAALSAVANRAAYIASKGAVIALTKSISVDFAHRGIRCNCIAPGTVGSPWIERMVQQYPDPEETRRQMVARQPIGRLGAPEEIAAAVLYLVSPAAAFAHGSCLVIDGGFSAR